MDPSRRQAIAIVAAPAGAEEASALERAVFLEWRLEQLEAALEAERDESRRLRDRLSEGALREAEAAGRIGDTELRLSEARREAASLADRLGRMDAERSALEKKVAGVGDRTAREAADLRRALLVERQRALVKGRALEHTRRRLEILEQARERFFHKLVEWQHLARSSGDEVDLAEFIAELRSEIVNLSAEHEAATRREARLRAALAEAGLDPEAVLDGTAPDQDTTAPERPAPERPRLYAADPTRAAEDGPYLRPAPTPPRPPVAPTPEPIATGVRAARARLEALPEGPRRERALRLLGELFGERRSLRLAAARALAELVGAAGGPALCAALDGAGDPEEHAALLTLLGRAGAQEGAERVEAGLHHAHTSVRKAALDAALRVLRLDPPRLEAALTEALGDPDVHVRRRALLAAAAAPGLDLRVRLAEGLRDPDPGCRRLAAAALSEVRAPAFASPRTAAAPTFAAVAKALRSALGGRTVDELAHDLGCPAAVLAPQLSRHASEGSLVRRGRKLFLP